MDKVIAITKHLQIQLSIYNYQNSRIEMKKRRKNIGKNIVLEKLLFSMDRISHERHACMAQVLRLGKWLNIQAKMQNWHYSYHQYLGSGNIVEEEI